LIAYLDTHVVIDLADASRERIGKRALEALRSMELLISPMVLLEIEYLHEIGRLRRTSRDVQLKLEAETSIRVCTQPFSTVARIALDEKWTRDAFDRIIVAQAKAKGFAFLISADERVAKHYPRTIW